MSAQYQDKNSITSRDLFKTISVITSVQNPKKPTDKLYHRPIYLDDSWGKSLENTNRFTKVT